MTSIAVRKKVVGAHAHLTVFAGVDADHRQNAGTLVVGVDQADDLIRLLETAEADPVLTPEHVAAVCQPGAGPATCAYLTMSPGGGLPPFGWTCAKGTVVEQTVRTRLAAGSMKSQGDNCPGRSTPVEP